ncbi:PQQ-binding-like beta-propeller repeat protein [Microbacterium luticocti]|uniref:outer membrane protein assembly factor BamB family protein n=1 Tax=Microbacterium luticocti TaxID=451764 RepID=UPI0004141603|nr:PQQ-binding-like beta-propeller repeat protein [Microbacterium luticocti]
MRHTRSRLAIAAVLSASAVLVAGCTVIPDAKPTPPSAWTQAATPIWRNHEALMSVPRVTGDTVLAYVSDGDGGEAVVAWDAATGVERWRHAAVPGEQAPGVRHRIPLLDDAGTTYTAFLAPLPDDWNENWGSLQVVDVVTGEPRRDAVRFLYGTRPEVCGDTFCLSALFDGETQLHARQYALDDGTIEDARRSDDDPAPYLDGGWFLGDYVSVKGASGKQMLRYGTDGRIRWERPYTDVFGAAATTEGGWMWDDGHLDLPVIGLGGPARQARGDTYTVDVAGSRLVGLDRATGKTVWSIPGAGQCEVTQAYVRDDGTLVACRVNSGTAQWPTTDKKLSRLRFTDFDMDLIGVDAKTGTIRWTVPLGADPRNFVSLAGPSLYSGGDPVAWIDDRATAIDPKTGATTPFPKDATLLCVDEATDIDLISVYGDADTGEFAYPAADRLYPCRSDGTRLDDGAISYGTLEAAGYDTSQPVALNLSTGSAVFAARPGG